MLHVDADSPLSARQRMRRLMAAGVLCVLGVALGLFATMASRRDDLADRDALLRAQGPGQWVVIGSFDERWPARVVGSIDGLGEVHFEHRGTPRSYEQFEGYRLRVVHLLDRDGHPATMVLRSASQGLDEPPQQRPERENVEQGVRR